MIAGGRGRVKQIREKVLDFVKSLISAALSLIEINNFRMIFFYSIFP
jgi:hypothetical protein